MLQRRPNIIIIIIVWCLLIGGLEGLTNSFGWISRHSSQHPLLPSITFPKIHQTSWRTTGSTRSRLYLSATDRVDISTLLRTLNIDDENSSWQSQLPTLPYVSSMLWKNDGEWKDFVLDLLERDPDADLLWEQIRLEALHSLQPEPEAGPQLYQSILSRKSLLDALISVIANELETEFFKAMELRSLFLQMLVTEEDQMTIAKDVIATASRSPSMATALPVVLFHTGLHALVCYRVGHRLWQSQRKGLAYYLQSSVSRRYSADIHPACQMGSGIYLSTTAGVVIGETAVLGDDVSILQGVTLGGTGKERGDRHPKVSNGVILCDGATVLGNIPVGEGAIITAKSIVTKPVPPLAIMSGIPAKINDYRTLDPSAFNDDLSRHLALKYLNKWQNLLPLP